MRRAAIGQKKPVGTEGWDNTAGRRTSRSAAGEAGRWNGGDFCEARLVAGWPAALTWSTPRGAQSARASPIAKAVVQGTRRNYTPSCHHGLPLSAGRVHGSCLRTRADACGVVRWADLPMAAASVRNGPTPGVISQCCRPMLAASVMQCSGPSGQRERTWRLPWRL